MKILVVDDHELIREGLKVVLGRLEGDVEVIEACSVASGLAVIRRDEDFDLAIFDMILPDGSGTRLMDELARIHPEVPMIVVSSEHQSMDVAFRHGAMGFVPKAALNSSLLKGVQEVLRGGIFIPAALSLRSGGESLESFRQPPTRSGAPDLSERQREVLYLMMQGFTNRAICKELALAESTVKIHVSAILRALRVTSRTQAVLLAAKMNIARLRG